MKMNPTESTCTIHVPEQFRFDKYRDFRASYLNLDKPYSKYVVNMKECSKDMHSCILGLLLQMREFLGDEKANIHLVNCNDDVIKILQLCSFDRLFSLEGQIRGIHHPLAGIVTP